MLRSMYAGVSGLKAHQTKMDVIGNNIANVNTVGFKGSSVNFKEMLNQTISTSQRPQGARGGVNPQQVGLGVEIGTISVNHGQGNLESTGVTTDLALDGGGYFVVNDGFQNLYTRAGDLDLDRNGHVVNSATGLKIQGWQAQDGELNTDQIISDLRIPLGDEMPAEKTTQAAFAGNLDSRVDRGISRSASIDIFDSLGDSHNVNLDFVRQITNNLKDTIEVGGQDFTIRQQTSDPAMEGITISFADGDELDATYDGGERLLTVAADWEDSPPSMQELEREINSAFDGAGYSGVLKVDNDDIDLTNIVGESLTLAAPGNLRISQAQDDPHQSLHNLNINFNWNADNNDPIYDQEQHQLTINWDGQPGDLAGLEERINEVIADEIEDLDGALELSAWDENEGINIDELANEEFTISAANHWDWMASDITGSLESSVSGDGTLIFNSNGQLSSGAIGDITFDPAGAAPVQSIEVNFDNGDSVNQLASNYSIDGVESDGYESGALDDFSISNEGIITGAYSNGINESLGQISIASFSNPDGLNKEGENIFSRSENSGSARIGIAGTGGRGEISSGSLEMSNVDLSDQFTEMITTQRGFQSNSQLITTTDEMLQTLVNLKR